MRQMIVIKRRLTMTNEAELRLHEKSNNSFKTKFMEQVKELLKLAKTKIP